MSRSDLPASRDWQAIGLIGGPADITNHKSGSDETATNRNKLAKYMDSSALARTLGPCNHAARFQTLEYQSCIFLRHLKPFTAKSSFGQAPQKLGLRFDIITTSTCRDTTCKSHASSLDLRPEKGVSTYLPTRSSRRLRGLGIRCRSGPSLGGGHQH